MFLHRWSFECCVHLRRVKVSCMIITCLQDHISVGRSLWPKQCCSDRCLLSCSYTAASPFFWCLLSCSNTAATPFFFPIITEVPSDLTSPSFVNEGHYQHNIAWFVPHKCDHPLYELWGKGHLPLRRMLPKENHAVLSTCNYYQSVTLGINSFWHSPV
jgi:hypothetical protein